MLHLPLTFEICIVRVVSYVGIGVYVGAPHGCLMDVVLLCCCLQMMALEEAIEEKEEEEEESLGSFDSACVLGAGWRMGGII